MRQVHCGAEPGRLADPFKGSNLGSFESRSEALRGAISVADQTGKSGAPAQVLAEDDAGMTHPIWVFGRDGCSLER